MPKPCRTTMPSPGYLLPEEAHERLLSLGHYMLLPADLS